MVVCDDLFVAIRTERTSTVIQQIARTHPEQIRKRNPEGQLPLHFALAVKKHRIGLIRFFIQKYPQSVRERNNAGELPLHLAARGDCQLSKVFRLLAEKFPQGIREKDYQGGLPLHHATATLHENNAWHPINPMKPVDPASVVHIIPFLVEQFPESVQVRDNYGYSPLHYLASGSYEALFGNFRLYLNTVQWLVEAFPQGVRERTHDRREYLPLHLVLRNTKMLYYSISMIRYLVEQYPEGLQVQAKDGSVPLFMVAELAVDSDASASGRQYSNELSALRGTKQTK